MSHLFKPSLLKKFLIAFILAAVIPLVIAEYITVRKAEDELKSTLNDQYYLVIDGLRRTIDELYIRSWINGLSTLSLSLGGKGGGNADELSAIMNAFVSQSEDILLITLLTPEGRPNSAVKDAALVAELYTQDSECFTRLAQFAPEPPAKGSFEVANPIIFPASGAIYLPLEMVVDWGSNRQATLRAVFNLNNMLRFMTREISIGQNELYIVDASGNIVFSNKNARFETGSVLPYEIAAKTRQAQTGQSRKSQVEQFDYDRESYLGISAGSQYINWEIYVVDKYSRAYALVAQAKKDIVLWIALAIFVCVVVSFFFARNFATSISYLAKVSKEIGCGNFDVTIHVPSKDELGQLGDSLQEMARGLKEAVRVREELLTIQQEVKIAGRIQQSILPVGGPDLSNIGFDARYIPMAGVAGDFYDFHVQGDHELGVLVADVSGHGIPAALISSMVKIAFSLQKPIADQPDVVLKGMNQTLSGKMEDQFLTASYIYLDLQKMHLKIADAGHLPLLIWRRKENRMLRIKPKGMIMGWMPNVNFPMLEQLLEDGDRLVMYTDGIPEAHNHEGEQFGEARLDEWVRTGADLAPNKFVSETVQKIREWVDRPEGFEDDITLVVIDIKPE